MKRLDDTFNENRQAKIDILGESFADQPVDHLFDVIIYDRQSAERPKTIVAKEGFVYLNPVKKVFEFILLDGEIYEKDIKNKSEFQHSYFDKTIFLMQAGEYVMENNEYLQIQLAIQNS